MVSCDAILHVDALCRLCSCVIAVLHTHSSVRARSLAAVRAQTCVADAVHLELAKRVRRTTRAMAVLPADFAWVVCEVWRAWRVIGDSFAVAGCCAGHGCLCNCVCDRSAAAVCGTFQRFDLRQNFQNTTNSLLNRFWSCQARWALLNRYVLLNNFS